MRCAALHRKLGTHVSKVKSLSMDTWSMEQVDVSALVSKMSTAPDSQLTLPSENENSRQHSEQ